MILSITVIFATGATNTAARHEKPKKTLLERYNALRNKQERWLSMIEGKTVSCRSAEKAITYYRLNVWKNQDKLGEPRIKTNFPERKKNACPYKRWHAQRWQALGRVYTEEVKSHYVLHDFKVVPGNSAWRKAVRETQKAYSGTENWLLSCSSTEGGHGRWVPNSDGYPPGGWMQMYHSTWSTMWYGWPGNEGAYRSLKARGFKVPRSAHSWYSPLGQALASAHGKMHGRGGEWHSNGCY